MIVRTRGSSSGDGAGGSESFDPEDIWYDPLRNAESWNSYVADNSAKSESWQEGESSAETQNHSVTRSTVLIPQMGQEV